MTEVVSVGRDGSPSARAALERSVRAGGVVLFPADTVYGLGCDPLSSTAVGRIHAIKGRDEGKPAAVMYFSPLAMRELLRDLGPRTAAAVGGLLPGPATLVLPNPARRYPLACGERPETLGVRLIDGPLAGASVALLQTSANRSGAPAPAGFEEVDPEVLEAVDLAIDGGALGGEASTVVDLSALDASGEWRILRDGALPRDEVARRLEGA